MHDDVFRPGELCATYRIIKLLGRGGFADVYQAVDLATQQKVALKCLQLRHLTNAQITQRMVAETELLAGLDHPNVIQVEDAGINGGVLWLAMEYIAGGTLRERLRKKGGPLPPIAALKYARQVAEGVGAAHGMQVVHRDLKPENIMITDKDEVKVLDLGAAKFFGKELTSTGAKGAIGTPLYMAPEQIKGEVVDVRTDIYALGTILYEMLAGRHPFAQPSGELPPAFEIGTLHLHAQPKPLTEIVDGLPEHVWRVVERAVAKEPDQRYATMDDFAKAILGARRRLLDDPSAGKVAGVIPLRRVPQYAEPSDVAAANDHHSGVRGVEEMFGAATNVDTLLDVEPPVMPEAVQSSPLEARDPGAISFSELVAQSGEYAGDAERAVAGSGRVPRMKAQSADVAPPPPVASRPEVIQIAPEKLTSAPVDVLAEPPVAEVAPEVFHTVRSADLARASRGLVEPEATPRVAGAPVDDALLASESPAPSTRRSLMTVVAPPPSVAPPSSSSPEPSKPQAARRRPVWAAGIVAGLAAFAAIVVLNNRDGALVASKATSALRGVPLIELPGGQAQPQVTLADLGALPDDASPSSPSPTPLIDGASKSFAAQTPPERARPSTKTASLSTPPSAPSVDTSKTIALSKCKAALLFAPHDHPACQPGPGPAGAPSTASISR